MASAMHCCDGRGGADLLLLGEEGTRESHHENKLIFAAFRASIGYSVLCMVLMVVASMQGQRDRDVADADMLKLLLLLLVLLMVLLLLW